MSSFLRKVQYKTNWDPMGEFSKYLPSGEAPADTLLDLRTSNNALSVWEIDDNGANFERVLAAIVSSCEHLQKMDYVVVDSKHIQALGVKIEKKKGETLDLYANESWHYDLIRLSATDLSRLANCLFAHGKSERQTSPKLIPMLKKSIEDGFVDQTKLVLTLREQLSKKE